MKHARLPEAVNALAELKAEADWLETIKQGDQAFTSGEYAEAMKHYSEAVRFRNTPELAAKVQQCRYRMAEARGDRFAAGQQWDEAVRAYEEAKTLGEPGPIDAKLQQLSIDREYVEKMQEGDRLLAARQFSRALSAYRDAQKIKDTPEIRLKQAEVTYERYLAMGKEKMAVQDWRYAQQYLEIAQEAKPTEEVKKLIAEVRAKRGG